MKKLLLTLCFILAVPILFSGSRYISVPFAPRVLAQCLPFDEGQAGNCAARRHSPSRGKSDRPREHGFHLQDLSSGLETLTPVFMIWLGMQR